MLLPVFKPHHHDTSCQSLLIQYLPSFSCNWWHVDIICGLVYRTAATAAAATATSHRLGIPAVQPAFLHIVCMPVSG